MNLRDLSHLPPQTVLTREDLASFFDCHETTITRAVQRGELPRPAKLCGANIWMVESILTHWRQLIDEEAARNNVSHFKRR